MVHSKLRISSEERLLTIALYPPGLIRLLEIQCIVGGIAESQLIQIAKLAFFLEE